MISLDWTPQQLDTLRANAFHRFITTSARVRGMAIEDYHRTTALAPIKPPPEVVTGEYLPPGARRMINGVVYNHIKIVPETIYNNDPSTGYRYR
jgi:hypothetical protein